MYCPGCGKKNDDDARFCAFCGAEIVDDQPEEVSVGQFLSNRVSLFLRTDARKGGAAAAGFLVRHKAAVIAVAAAVVLIIGGSALVRSLFDPVRTARHYFESYMAGDWSDVYYSVYLPEGELLDEAHFLAAAENWAPSGYLDYQVEPLDDMAEEDSLYRRYRFTYSTPGSTSSSQMDVTMIRTGKKALFFDDYRVSLEGLIAEGCTVEIPEGAVLLLNGEPLETEAAQGAGQICQLPDLFAGTYTLGMEHPVYQCQEMTVDLVSGSYVNLLSGCWVELTALEDPASGDAADYLSELFDTAVAGEDLSESGVPLSDRQDATAQEDFREFRSDCASRAQRRGTFRLTTAELDSAEFDSDTGLVRANLSYSCTGRGLELTDQPYTFSGSARLTLAYDSGTWQLVELYVSGI